MRFPEVEGVEHRLLDVAPPGRRVEHDLLRTGLRCAMRVPGRVRLNAVEPSTCGRPTTWNFSRGIVTPCAA